jgi:hypothetical protein
LLGRAPISRPDGQPEANLTDLDGPEYTYGDADPDPDDDSGVLRYVRIEHAGYVMVPPSYAPGLTLAGVGRGTTLDHVMVSNVKEDCFRFHGGTVRADHLVANNCGDDYVDAREGFQGGGKYWFGRRANYAFTTVDAANRPLTTEADGLEIQTLYDGAPDDGSARRTNVSVSNLTLCGTAYDSFLPSGSYGLSVRSGAKAGIDNLAVVGFDYGIDTRDAFEAADLRVENSTFWSFIFALDNDATETGNSDDDRGFADASVLTEEASNAIEPNEPPFRMQDCIKLAGPDRSVLASETGAFIDGGDWMTGAWIDWAEE